MLLLFTSTVVGTTVATTREGFWSLDRVSLFMS